MSSVYYDEELKSLWQKSEHCSVYESNVINGENCDCCKKRTWAKRGKK